MSLQEKMKKLKLTPLPMHKSPTPVQMSLDEESLPDEVKQVVSKRGRGVNCLLRKGLWHAIELQSNLQEGRQRL